MIEKPNQTTPKQSKAKETKNPKPPPKIFPKATNQNPQKKPKNPHPNKGSDRIP